MESYERRMDVSAGSGETLDLLARAGEGKELTVSTLDMLIRAAIEDTVKPDPGWERTTELCRLVLQYPEEIQSGNVHRLLQWEEEKLMDAAVENCCDVVLAAASSILSLACKDGPGDAESNLNRYMNNPKNRRYHNVDRMILQMAGALFEAGKQIAEGTPPALAATAAAVAMTVEAGCHSTLKAAEEIEKMVLDISEGRIGERLDESTLEEARKAMEKIDALRREIDGQRTLGSRINVQKNLKILKQKTMEKAWVEHKKQMESEYI